MAAINKSADEELRFTLELDAVGTVTVDYICGDSTEAYNDVDHDGVVIQHKEFGIFESGMMITLPPHSVNVIRIGVEEV